MAWRRRFHDAIEPIALASHSWLVPETPQPTPLSHFAKQYNVCSARSFIHYFCVCCRRWALGEGVQVGHRQMMTLSQQNAGHAEWQYLRAQRPTMYRESLLWARQMHRLQVDFRIQAVQAVRVVTEGGLAPLEETLFDRTSYDVAYSYNGCVITRLRSRAGCPAFLPDDKVNRLTSRKFARNEMLVLRHLANLTSPTPSVEAVSLRLAPATVRLAQTTLF